MNNYIVTEFTVSEIIETFTEEKLKDSVMRYDMFVANASVWKKHNQRNKSKVLDVISNVLFYWPLSKSLVYTRKISIEALKRFIECGTMMKNTNEHFYPRKQTTELFFKLIIDGKLPFEKFLIKYVNVYGKYHITTPMENKALAKSYEKINFETWEDAYRYNNILLVDDPTYGKVMIDARKKQLLDQLDNFEESGVIREIKFTIQ